MRDFSANDRRLIREAVREIMNEPRNVRSRPGTNDSFSDQDYLAPEVYVAKPQSGSGIAALSGTTPGSGLCDIYRLVSGSLVAVSGSAKLVYNLSTVVLTQDFFEVKRDKYGEWYAGTPSGSQAGAVAAVLRGLTTAAVSGGSFSADGIVVMSPVGAPVPSDPITGIVNLQSLDALENAKVLIFRQGETSTYYGILDPDFTDCS